MEMLPDALIDAVDLVGVFPDAERPEIDPVDRLDLVIEVADVMATFATERLSRVAAFHAGMLADAGRERAVSREIVDRSARLEIAAALRVTEHAAGRLLAMADAVVRRYPAVLTALYQARVTERHAEILVDALDLAVPEHRDFLSSRGIALAAQQPVGAFRRSLVRLVESLQQPSRAERHETALVQRRVVVEQADDGMAWLMAYLPAVEAHAIDGRLTALAKTVTGCVDETRTIGQMRADVLSDLLVDGTTASSPAEARGVRASVVVTVPVLALLSEGGEVLAGCDAPTVEGVGPVPLDVVRELCGGADGWTRVLTHPETGMVLSVGRERYQPPPSLRRLAKWRAERCMAPGCGVPAARCQVDHTIAWEHGGSTSLENLAPMCQGHHTIKHHGGWTVRQIEGSGGVLEWRSPAGRRYEVVPERRVPVFRVADAVTAPF